jgi:hypothetical protein
MKAPSHDGKPPRERPGWLVKILAAKKAAFDALSDAEKAEAAAGQLALRERAKERRQAALELAQRIFGLHDTGHHAEEIAAQVGRHAISVVQFAASRGVFISRSARVAHRAVVFTREREEALRRMAADYGTAPVKALDDLLTFSLDDDAAVARRILHVRRTPNANPHQLACGGAAVARRREDAGRDRQDAESAAVDGPMGAQ